ncbi:hypothetical protein GCM10023177_35880 [Streptomyces violaceoruber]|nr:hypothetical protein JCM4020_35420 [Streptomyces coelicolor]
MPYDVGDQLRERQLGGAGHLGQARADEVQPQHAAQMAGRVRAQGELGVVLALDVRRLRTGYVIHATTLRRGAYARLHTETNAERCCRPVVPQRGAAVANIQSLDPTASPLDYYGWELRRQREAHGLKQGQLGDIIFCTGSLVGQIETTKKVPTRDFSERVDAALGTDGLFSRLIGLVLRSQLPTWFQPYAEMEAKAAYISTYQAQLVYGLLQTEEYARAVLATGKPGQLDSLLAARMERQRILAWEKPPVALVILDEAVLHRPIGGDDVMWRQLAHLLEFTNHRWMCIQVLPLTSGEHPGLAGAFNILRFEDHPDVFYTEDMMSGHMTANPETIKEASLNYAHLQADALSVKDSAALIARVMEERYADRTERDPVA